MITLRSMLPKQRGKGEDAEAEGRGGLSGWQFGEDPSCCRSAAESYRDHGKPTSRRTQCCGRLVYIIKIGVEKQWNNCRYAAISP